MSNETKRNNLLKTSLDAEEELHTPQPKFIVGKILRTEMNFTNLDAVTSDEDTGELVNRKQENREQNRL